MYHIVSPDLRFRISLKLPLGPYSCCRSSCTAFCQVGDLNSRFLFRPFRDGPILGRGTAPHAAPLAGLCRALLSAPIWRWCLDYPPSLVVCSPINVPQERPYLVHSHPLSPDEALLTQMAEALAVVGIVANIVQLVDFGSKILHRLTEFQSSVENVPESFRHIKAKLPLLLHTLQQTKEAIEAGSIKDDTTKALLPAIEGCWEQIKLLDEVLLKTLPSSGDSWTKRSRKAIWMSLRYDSKVEKITAIIRDYIQTLTYHHATTSSTLMPIRGILSKTLNNTFRHGGNTKSPANRAASAQGDPHQDLPRAPLYLFVVTKAL